MDDKTRYSELTTRENIHVLLVDDQKMVAMAVESLFKTEADIEFSFCKDPSEALAKAIEINPNVILQDINLSAEVSGFDLMAQYRSVPLLEKTPVIMLSAEEDPIIKANSFEKGANDYLIKIPDKVELIARVRHHAKSYALELERDLALQALRVSQSDLMSSNSQLAQKNIALQNFAHMVAHDLKNPLASVKGYMEYLEEAFGDQFDDEIKEVLGKVHMGANSMADLVNKILAFSKSGAVQVRKELCHISDLVKEARVQLDWQIRERQAQIEEHFEAEELLGDRRLLIQVFVNLMSNALKYCPKDRVPQLKIRSRLAGETFEIAFEDNGKGIPETEFETIFLEFQRLQGADEQAEGSGIGLYTCKKIIRSHDGHITVQSKVDRGSTFTLVMKPETND
jgi:signal transduction histidine kinase